MEEVLRAHIVLLTQRYGEALCLSEGTVLKHAAGDGRFLSRTADGSKTFTVRVYDNIIQWFSDHWPATTAWPSEIVRPKTALVMMRDGSAFTPAAA